jgi:hypothetical protein
MSRGAPPFSSARTRNPSWADRRSNVIGRPDLGDRAIFVTLSPIAEQDRRPELKLWREFEIERPLIFGALLDALVHGLRTINRVQFEALPRMADFALWAAACEPAFWPTGTFARAYAANRRAAIKSIIEADPVATCVRTIMAERSSWSGNASDLLRLCAERAHEDASMNPPWARNPRALAGRLRRAQTFHRMLDIEISFYRQGRSGERVIRITAFKNDQSGDLRINGNNGYGIVSTVSSDEVSRQSTGQ